MPSCRACPGAGLVDARDGSSPDGTLRERDRVAVFGGCADTLALLRLASVRSDDLLLIADAVDAATLRFVETFAVELRSAPPTDGDVAGASAVVVSLGDRGRENALVRAARRRGIPVHVAGRPLVSDFTMLELVERNPASFARRA